MQLGGGNSSSVYNSRLQCVVSERSQWQGHNTAHHLHVRSWEQRELSMRAHLLDCLLALGSGFPLLHSSGAPA